RRRHTRFSRDWSSDVCSSDLPCGVGDRETADRHAQGERIERHRLDGGLATERVGQAGFELRPKQRRYREPGREEEEREREDGPREPPRPAAARGPEFGCCSAVVHRDACGARGATPGALHGLPILRAAARAVEGARSARSRYGVVRMIDASIVPSALRDRSTLVVPPLRPVIVVSTTPSAPRYRSTLCVFPFGPVVVRSTRPSAPRLRSTVVTPP